VRRIQALHAVAKFRDGSYESAMDTFISLDINPAKVVALFPESISGRLSVPEKEWIPLFGGPKPIEIADPVAAQIPASTSEVTAAGEGSEEAEKATSPKSSIRGAIKIGIESIIPAALKDDDSASAKTAPAERPKGDDSLGSFFITNLLISLIAEVSKQAAKELERFLTDRRPKLDGALRALHIFPAQSHQFPELSTVPMTELFELPNIPPAQLAPEQLVRAAQVVYTALFWNYLMFKPVMLGPLCRAPNWCEVRQVEEELTAIGVRSHFIHMYLAMTHSPRATETHRTCFAL
jgi:Vam6/Vps39-like protein vacuolar protein sorting-associated protein 39